ncbi:MAG: hypothetical protein N4A32_02810 [Marinifilaceae bacterium]|jgi:antitoxin component YwqK of YwqJK toxin-antitoxin module|nr:hypothetical protein [Marinifilaceae bacterium]
MRRLLLLVLMGISTLTFAQKQMDYKEKHYPNGKLMYKGMFRDGKPVGVFKRYYPTGIIKAELNYFEKYVNATFYNKTGKLIATGRYVDNKKDSIWNYFSEDRLISRENYVKGKKDGDSFLYYPEGGIKETIFWNNGVKEGEWRRFYRNKKLMFLALFTKGKLDGKFVAYNRKGEISIVGKYVDAYKEGTWTYYRGAHEYTITYSMGLEVSSKNKPKEEKSNKKIVDPEKYMSNPYEFLKQVNSGGSK